MPSLRVSHFLSSVSLKREEVPSFDAYPFRIPAIRSLGDLELHPQVTFFVGENAMGKSTLLEAIAEKLGFSLEGGSLGTNLAVNAFRSALTPHLVLHRTYNRPSDGFFLRAESYYNFASAIDEIEATPWCGGLLDSSYGGKSLHAQSHGESFFTLLTQRLGGDGVYLFDEPEAALSPKRQLAMLVRMQDLLANSSQFIIATHSPLILAYPDAWIYRFGDSGIERVSYEETEAYLITRNFLRDPKGMLTRLLGPEPSTSDMDV